MPTTNLRSLLVSLLVFGCAPAPSPQPASDGGAPDASTALDYPTFVARSIEIGCAFLFECCEAGERTALGSGHSDAAACERAQNEAARRSVDAVVELVAEGGVIFDAALAAECLAELEGGSCEARSLEVGRIDGRCAEVIRGTTPTGGACGRAPCADGICTDGLCQPYPAEGDACWGLRCAGGAVCVEGTCALPRAEGEACARDFECRHGLLCRGTCVPLDRCLGG